MLRFSVKWALYSLTVVNVDVDNCRMPLACHSACTVPTSISRMPNIARNSLILQFRRPARLSLQARQRLSSRTPPITLSPMIHRSYISYDCFVMCLAVMLCEPSVVPGSCRIDRIQFLVGCHGVA